MCTWFDCSGILRVIPVGQRAHHPVSRQVKTYWQTSDMKLLDTEVSLTVSLAFVYMPGFSDFCFGNDDDGYSYWRKFLAGFCVWSLSLQSNLIVVVFPSHCCGSLIDKINVLSN